MSDTTTTTPPHSAILLKLHDQKIETSSDIYFYSKYLEYLDINRNDPPCQVLAVHMRDPQLVYFRIL